jgi:hypothetical protein
MNCNCCSCPSDFPLDYVDEDFSDFDIDDYDFGFGQFAINNERLELITTGSSDPRMRANFNGLHRRSNFIYNEAKFVGKPDGFELQSICTLSLLFGSFGGQGLFLRTNNFDDTIRCQNTIVSTSHSDGATYRVEGFRPSNNRVRILGRWYKDDEMIHEELVLNTNYWEQMCGGFSELKIDGGLSERRYLFDNWKAGYGWYSGSDRGNY